MQGHSSDQDINKLQENGWYLIAVDGNQYFYKHSINGLKVTIKHPCKIIPPKTLQAIIKQSKILTQEGV